MGRTLNTILALVGIGAAVMGGVKIKDNLLRANTQQNRVYTGYPVDLQRNLGGETLNEAIEYLFNMDNKFPSEIGPPTQIQAGYYWKYRSNARPGSKVSVWGLINSQVVDGENLMLPVKKEDYPKYDFFPFEPETHFSIIKIKCEGTDCARKGYPELEWRDVDIKKEGEPSASIFYYRLVKRNAKSGRADPKDLMGYSMGWVSEDGSEVAYYRVHIKQGINVQEFLESGGVPPQDWPDF